MVARHWSSSRLSCGKRHLVRCDGTAGNSFSTTQRKDASSRARRRKRGPSGCGRDSRTSSRVETGMSGNFLRYSKGVKDPLDVPEVKCDLPADASAEMGLISLEGRTSWIFSSCCRCSRLTRGPQGPALLASGKACPHASCSGASIDSSPVYAGALDLVWSRCWNLRFPLQC